MGFVHLRFELVSKEDGSLKFPWRTQPLAVKLKLVLGGGGGWWWQEMPAIPMIKLEIPN